MEKAFPFMGERARRAHHTLLPLVPEAPLSQEDSVQVGTAPKNAQEPPTPHYQFPHKPTRHQKHKFPSFWQPIFLWRSGKWYGLTPSSKRNPYVENLG